MITASLKDLIAEALELATLIESKESEAIVMQALDDCLSSIRAANVNKL
jgi:hypothetical protein